MVLMGVHDFDYDMYVVTVCPGGWGVVRIHFHSYRIVKFLFLNIIIITYMK